MYLRIMSGGREEESAIAQADDGPAAAGGVRGERRVGIDRDRMGDLLEQRQVVQRIAIEPALVVGEAMALRREPFVHPLDLSLAKRRSAARLGGEDAVDLLDVGGDKGRAAQLGGDRRGDEAAGRGGDGGEPAGG